MEAVVESVELLKAEVASLVNELACLKEMASEARANGAGDWSRRVARSLSQKQQLLARRRASLRNLEARGAK